MRAAREGEATLSALALACAALGSVACSVAAPPDSARLDTLSSDERVALCDELRDAVARDDHPVQCGGFDFHWLLPSNQSCRAADLSACDGTAGEARRFYELARSDPCSIVSIGEDDSITDPSTPVSMACPALAPRLELGEPACEGPDLSRLQAVEGVYEVTASEVPSRLPCAGTLPALLDRAAPRLVLVATQASGVAEVIAKSCQSAADCQELARALRVAGDPDRPDPNTYDVGHFDDCGWMVGAPNILLSSRVPAGMLSCEPPWLPRSELLWAGAAGLTVTVYPALPAQPSPGCGYVVAPSPDDIEACSSSARHEARFESALEE